MPKEVKSDDLVLAKSSKQSQGGVATKKVTGVKKTRKVKFSDPLTKQRVYDRGLSPDADTESKIKIKATKQVKTGNTLENLEPPFSLVAKLDLAAHRLNARSVDNKSVVDKEMSPKTLKSTGTLGKAFKSKDTKKE